MTPSRVLHLEMLGFLYCLAAIIAFQILTRRIQIAGLLSNKNKKDEAGQLSPGRVQLLLATLAASASYLTEVANTTNGNMPDISSNWLCVFGGSGGVYVLEKAWVAWNKTKSS